MAGSVSRPSDPTPPEYDEPFEHIEWGVMTAEGEIGRDLPEELARLTVRNRDDLTLIRRRVVYDPWHVVSKAESVGAGDDAAAHERDGVRGHG